MHVRSKKRCVSCLSDSQTITEYKLVDLKQSHKMKYTK